MDANAKAQRILKELHFDFSTFTIDGFLDAMGEKKGREIISIPWEMPPTMFGAWISDGDEPREYIFYRNNVSQAHQIHIQLHELSHFLFGHPTLQINRKMISDVVAGTASFPFAELPKLRSPEVADVEAEAEALAHLVQKQAIRNSNVDLLVRHTSPEEKLATFLRKMGRP